ncbi:hypothetical protein ACHQM5_005034 [Ranunculus cassubicifolius]
MSELFEGEALLKWRASLSNYSAQSPLGLWNTTSTSPCVWAGIAFNREGRVIRIELNGNLYYDVKGTLKNFNFSSFPYLSTLTLTSRDVYASGSRSGILYGILPHGIGTLSRLTHLDLSWNNFSGPLPLKLTYIDLSYNSFSDKLPPSLINCVQLLSLQLQSNFFSGSIPSGYGYLKDLTQLVLADNQLSGVIPEGIKSSGKR